MRLSIVMVNYNAGPCLVRAAESLHAHPCKGDWELVVVDNASADDSIAQLQARFPAVQVLTNPRNEGFPHANNQAFDLVAGDHILMLNPDTEVMPGALDRMLDLLEGDPTIGIVGPQMVDGAGQPYESCWRHPSLARIFANELRANRLFGLWPRFEPSSYGPLPPDRPSDVDSVQGSAMMFPATLLDTVGLLDTTLFWIEDVDFCTRTREAGLRVVYLPTARIAHIGGVSGRKNYRISLSNQVFNKIKYLRVHGTPFEVVAVQFLSLAVVAARIAALAVLSLARPARADFRGKLAAYWYTLPRIMDPPEGMA